MFSPSSSPASRRIQLLQQQLNSETKFVTSQREDARRLDKSTSLNNTHGCLQESYTVVLPEVLTPDGEWGVHRSRESPHRLVSRFPAPNEHIRTLHDNWECSVRKYREEPCLGSRTLKPNGKLGEYRWKSYSEVALSATRRVSELIVPVIRGNKHGRACQKFCLLVIGWRGQDRAGLWPAEPRHQARRYRWTVLCQL